MIENKPLVSVIMAVYNSESTVQDTIDSIVNQTYRNWQLVVCDDCSEDNSYYILEQNKKRLGNQMLLLRNERNMKLAYTLNYCLRNSAGEYIARMDSDDICMPERFFKQVDFLESHREFDVVGTAAKVYNGSEVTEIRYPKEQPEKEDLLKIVPHIHPSIMMRKSVYDSLGGYTVSNRTMRGQDIDLWFRFYASGHKGYNLQEPLIQYHESLDDMKKRTIGASIGVSKTMIKGFQLMGFKKIKYVYALKPIVSYFVPQRFKRALRIRKNEKSSNVS